MFKIISVGEILEQPATIKIIILILFLFIATAGLWIRPTLFGIDSYSTLSLIRFGYGETLLNQPVANFFFGLLPDSIVLFKLIMFSSIVLTILPIWLIVKKWYNERFAWISIFLLVSLSPIILFEFGKFENEVFAFPFIVWAIYFLLSKKYFESVSCMAIGLLFWKWIFYLTFFNNSSSGIIEMNLFSGLINFWLLIPFIFFIPLIKNRFVVALGIFSLIATLINAKLFILLIPFIALAIPKALILLDKYPTIRISLYILAFLGLFGWNIAFFMQQPTQTDVFFVSESIKLANDNNLPLYNDSSFGYWIMAQGYKTKFNAGTWENFDENNLHGIYLTEKDLNCLLIDSKKVIGRKQIAIYHCE